MIPPEMTIMDAVAIVRGQKVAGGGSCSLGSVKGAT